MKKFSAFFLLLAFFSQVKAQDFIIPPGKSISLTVTFDACWSHRIKLFKNDKLLKEFYSRDGTQSWSGDNTGSTSLFIRFSHEFEQERFDSLVGFAINHRKEWTPGKSNTEKNTESHFIIGYDDFPWGAVGKVGN